MPLKSERMHLIDSFLLSFALRDVFSPPQSWETRTKNLESDSAILLLLENTRYLQDHNTGVPKQGNLEIAWEYAQNPAHHHRFINMLRVSPLVFLTLLDLIEDHPVFSNSSNNPQAPVEEQLATTLFRMGRYGNGASVQDIARTVGRSEGTVENFTKRCFTAILSLYGQFIRQLSQEEKEVEKQWMDNYLGFVGSWRDGWVMYDGTIVVLHRKPTLSGNSYYTRKANYGLNLQIGNIASNLRIVDFSHGMTGAAHDAAAFEGTTASKHPDWFFDGEEFAWADSAYAVNSRTIPVHRKPASLNPKNALFDKKVSSLRVRSEHCVGALKGRFQCLRGLRATIATNDDHYDACIWITVSIILHNAVIDIEGKEAADYFGNVHGRAEEDEDTGIPAEHLQVDDGPNNAKRRQLVEELWAITSH